MKPSLTITLARFSGFNENPPILTVSYVDPSTDKDVVEIAARIRSNDFLDAINAGYEKALNISDNFPNHEVTITCDKDITLALINEGGR